MRTEKYTMNHSQALQALNLAAGASKEQLKAAYRRAAVKHHPDKRGKQEDFVLCKEAYDLLVEQGTTERVEQGFNHLFGFSNQSASVEVRVYYRADTATQQAQRQYEQAMRDAQQARAQAAGVRDQFNRRKVV